MNYNKKQMQLLLLYHTRQASQSTHYFCKAAIDSKTQLKFNLVRVYKIKIICRQLTGTCNNTKIPIAHPFKNISKWTHLFDKRSFNQSNQYTMPIYKLSLPDDALVG